MNRFLQWKRALSTALLLLLMSAGVTKVFADETFTVGYYKYYILSEADRTVSIGYDVYNNTFPNNFMAELPRTVTYQNVTYTVTQISGAGFWYCPQLLAISIPNTVTRIREYAFKGCENLQTVVIPNSVEDIEKCVFEDCPALQSAYWPENPDCWKIYNGTFRGCTGLLRYTFPENVTSIDMEAFKNCTSLEEITLSKTMNGIATHAFENCSSLRSVYSYRMDAPPTIVAETFKGAFAEGATIYVPYEALYKYQTEYWMNQHNYAWPASSNDITADMFEVIPADMFLTYTYFEDDARVEGAREGIAGDLVIPNTVRHNNEDFPVTDVAPWAFKNCNTLTSVVFPENMESILAEAFYDCDGLTMVDMSACTNMTHLGSYNFEKCKDLTTVILPPNLLILDYGPFIGCTGLTSIDLPNTLTTIGPSVFSSSGLTSITIPASVTTIEGSAFKYCEGLTEIYALRPTPPETNELAFWSVNNDIPVYVPYGSGDAYRAATGWSRFNNIQELPADIQYYYDEVNHTATVTGYGGAFSGSLEIPATVEYNNETYTVTAIGANAFKNYYTMTNVILPNTITSIGADAFRSCHNATINIPENLTSLGEGAFADCDHLTSVTLPEGLTSIPALAFYSCNSLTELHLPSTLTSIGIRAFAICTNLENIVTYATTPPTCQVGNGNDSFLNVSCVVHVPYGYYNAYHTAAGWSSLYIEQGGLIYTMNEDITEAIIIGVHENTFGDLVIPSQMNNCPTTTIAANAFKDKSGITSFSLPATVTTIGSQAFANCSSLTAINVDANNANYKSVDGVLFSKDGKTLVAYPSGKADTYYNMPASVENITDYAFEGSKNLTSLKLSASLSSTTNFPIALYGTDNLETLTVDAGNTYFIAIDGVLFTNPATNLIYYPRGKAGHYTVPSTVTYILSQAFADCTKLTGITLNDGLQSIEMYAFARSTGLTSISIPEGITNIYMRTFMGCSSLKTVNLPTSLNNIAQFAFANTGLISLTLPANIQDIGDNAFAGCTDLAEVTLNSLYLFIPSGQYIFDGIDTSEIPLYVNAAQLNNFANNAPWRYFDVQPWPTPNGYLLYTWSDIDNTAVVTGVSDKLAISGNLVIPGTLTRNNKTYTVVGIDDQVFDGCVNLTSVTIPHTVESIGVGAFHACTGLQSLSIGRNVKSIGTYAFEACNALTTIDYYPVNCQQVGQQVWKSCGTGSKTLNIKNCVQTIPDDAFYGLKGLSSVTIPSSVTAIGESAFSYCDMTSVIIGNNVKTIGSGAFYESGLTSVDLQNVETLGNAAFYGCADLATVTLRNSQQTISESCFENCTSLNNVHIPSGVRTIGKQAFKGCTGLTNLVFDNPFQGQLTTISEEAFSGCGLTAVDIPNTVTTVGDWAFYGNTNLTTASIGTGMQYMGSSIFYNCTNLATIHYWATHCNYTGGWGNTGTGTKTLNLHNGVNYIPGGAFSGLILNEVTIPNGVTFIGEYAFAYCENLTEITIPNSVTYLGEAAFAGNQLENITLGNGLASIGEYAFGTDESQQYLQSVTSYNVTPPSVYGNSFNTGDYEYATLYVLGEATVSTYQTAPIWGNFFNIQSMDGYYFTGATDSNWGTASNWSTGEVPTTDPLMMYIDDEWNEYWDPDYAPNVIIISDITVDIPNAFAYNLTIFDGNVVTVASGKKLQIGSDMNGSFIASDASALVVEDGGQLWNDVEVQATVEKNIAGYNSKSANGWHFIASPMGGFWDSESNWISPASVDGMIAETPRQYDLYSFDQEEYQAEWRNYKAGTFGLRNGWGYLYANANTTTLKFEGTIQGYQGGASMDLYYTDQQIEVLNNPDDPEGGSYYESIPSAGWNLMGNPFACDAYLNNMSSDFSYLNFYQMNAQSNGIEPVENVDAAIPACTGIFVQTPLQWTSVSFVRELESWKKGVSNNGNLHLSLSAANEGPAIDKVIVSFNEGSQLEKYVFNKNISQLYITQNGKDYAIANTTTDGEMPVCFKATSDGSYTIAVSPVKVEVAYLHLIDTLTGADVDLLSTPSYSFEAQTTDNVNRFRLVFSRTEGDK